MNLLVIFGITLGFVSCEQVVPLRDEWWPPQSLIEPFLEFKPKCIDETGTTQEKITQFSDGEIFEDPKLKCYMKCMMMNANVLLESGKVDVMPIMQEIEKLPRENQTIILRAGAKCMKPPPGDDFCEKAFEIQKCMKLRDPVHFFLV